MYICIFYNILYGIKYTISYHILICNYSICIYALLQTQNSFFCIPFMIVPLVKFCFENSFDVNLHHKQLLKPPLFIYALGSI